MGAGIISAVITKKKLDGIEDKEINLNEVSENEKNKKGLEPDVNKIKSRSLESLILENEEKDFENDERNNRLEAFEEQEIDETNDDGEGKEGLKDEEKQKIKEDMGWSDEIIGNIRSMREYEIYKKAGLREMEIGDRKALIRSNIDWTWTDEKGRTNADRVKRGLAPLDKEGNALELHHIGQHADSPLAELTFKEHRCDGNDTVLHDKKKETETHGEGSNWDNERQNYWKDRGEYNENGEGGKK